MITPLQLKKTNIIFAEHKKLLQENLLLNKQLKNYKELNDNLLVTDSLRVTQLNEYSLLTKSYEDQIQTLNIKVNKKERSLKAWKICGVSISAGFLLYLIFK